MPIPGSSALCTELIFTCPWTPHYLSYFWFLLPRDVQGDWRNPNGRIYPGLSLHLDLKELWDFCAFPASFIFKCKLVFPYNQEVRPLRQSASLLDAPVKALCKVPAWLVLNTTVIWNKEMLHKSIALFFQKRKNPHIFLGSLYNIILTSPSAYPQIFE